MSAEEIAGLTAGLFRDIPPSFEHHGIPVRLTPFAKRGQVYFVKLPDGGGEQIVMDPFDWFLMQHSTGSYPLLSDYSPGMRELRRDRRRRYA